MSLQRSVDWKTFGEDDVSAVLLVEGSRIYEIDPDFKAGLDKGHDEAVDAIRPSLPASTPLDLKVPAGPAPQSISLNVSSSCNLSCDYCYAARGGFKGVQTRHMNWSVAQTAIDGLFAQADPRHPLTVGFIGGEPFVNRRLIHRATEYAASRGSLDGFDVRFSVTTNGSLLTEGDLDLMREHRFAVTFSLDGDAALHEAQRKGARFSQIVAYAQSLLERPGLAQIAARATVMPHAMDLCSRFEAIHAIGFRDIGFAPVRMGGEEKRFGAEDWPRYLADMIALGRREAARLLGGGESAFSNLVVALKKIHAGACSPYPCGAGGGYFSVGADGRWYACHRAIGDVQFEMGTSEALDQQRRARFLQDRHVHAQTDCKTCWARYLCSGGCHQEASARSVASCDFIRGWLEFCLDTYFRLERTEYFRR